ncbi:hypothetical protein GCM10010211_58390 [Streptomyces albospinus]|uniref:Uncharacterized protein n=1 Tax=Streptomyces albospinus TaxID=285515 RepID=A0ABQ2VFS1_9ACTN|nr:hypothetical protein GCM10010211_58390 [Streptomyces albospinus]
MPEWTDRAASTGSPPRTCGRGPPDDESGAPANRARPAAYADPAAGSSPPQPTCQPVREHTNRPIAPAHDRSSCPAIRNPAITFGKRATSETSHPYRENRHAKAGNNLI